MPALHDKDLGLPLSTVHLSSVSTVSAAAPSSISLSPAAPASPAIMVIPSSTDHLEAHPSATTAQEPLAYHELMHRKYKCPGWTPIGSALTAR